MRRRAIFGFLALNIVVTVAVVSGVLYAYNRFVPPPTARQAPPLIVAVSNTPDPNVTPQTVYVVVTATPGSGQTDPMGSTGSNPNPAVAALNPTVGLATGASTAAATTAANGCVQYTVKSGDVPSTIASQFGISLADLYNANGMKPDPVLHIGQILIIPGPSCDTATPTLTNTPTATITVALLPSSTVGTASASQPTTANAITITQVVRPGDITAEGVSLHNSSSTDTIDLTSWTLSDQAGNTYTFPTYRLFPNGDLLINTRSGSDTPRVLFWGLSSALWGTQGTEVTLKDASGTPQATYAVGG
jgi:LysM repeat protein